MRMRSLKKLLVKVLFALHQMKKQNQALSNDEVKILRDDFISAAVRAKDLVMMVSNYMVHMDIFYVSF